MKQGLSILLLSLLLPIAEVCSQDVVCEGEKGAQERVASDQTKVNIAVYDRYLYVFNASENTILEVKNMLGENVLEVKLTSPSEKIALDLKKGFYIVRVDNVLQRIVIK